MTSACDAGKADPPSPEAILRECGLELARIPDSRTRRRHAHRGARIPPSVQDVMTLHHLTRMPCVPAGIRADDPRGERGATQDGLTALDPVKILQAPRLVVDDEVEP
jgi:hypothetical protein